MFELRRDIKKIELEGDIKDSQTKSIGRLRFTLICLFLCFFLVILKITNLSILYNQKVLKAKNYKNNDFIVDKRADIVDRNGEILAISLPSNDLFANPTLIREENKENLAKEISKILHNVSEKEIYSKLKSKKKFVYLKRQITPREWSSIEKIGEPNIRKLKRYIRHYPHQEHAAHILGGVNIDNLGIKGIEKSYDKILKDKNFVKDKNSIQLSIDIGIQKILDNHLNETITKHSAVGGSGIILDIKNSEILAMSSLPQFNPNKISKITKKNEFNMSTLGVYELGSVFKSLILAMALDKEILSENTIYDATYPIKEGKFTIHDYKPKKRPLKISECVIYSSNICFAKVGQDLGEKNLRSYLSKMKLNDKPEIEIPEIGEPLLPDIWRKTNIMTVSFGHGIAVSPLQFVNAFSSIINGGHYRDSTLIKNKYSNKDLGHKVISHKTSLRIRNLLREVVRNKDGSGDKAEVPGFFVAGKTGTAIKIKSNRYEKNENITSFVGFFPSYDPKYIVFILVDDPKPIKETFNYATGGWVAAPTVKKIINEIVPKLGLNPEDKENDEYFIPQISLIN